MKLINRLFWRGFIVVMPITLSVYLLLIVLGKAESLFGNFVKQFIGEGLYIPGLGIVITIFLMILVGLLVSNYLTGSIIKFFMGTFEKLPLLKAIYNPLKDLISLFGGAGTNQMKKVVLVKLEKLGVETIGLVTREDFDDISPENFEETQIAVYIPLSYMLGGFTVIISRSQVKEVDIPVEKALKLAITGWIKSDKNLV